MLDQIRAEFFKLRKRWLPYVLLIVLVTSVLLPLVVNYINYKSILSENPELVSIEVIVNPDGSRTVIGLPPPDPETGYNSNLPAMAFQASRYKENIILPGAMGNIFASIPGMGMFLVMILAASIIGNEYGWGTVRQAIARGSGRFTYLAAKVSTSAISVIVGVVSVVLIGLVAAIITSLLAEGSIAWEGFGGYFFASLGRSLLVVLVYLAMASFFSVLLRSAMAGMAVAMVWFIGESIVLALLSMSTGWLADLHVYFVSYNTSQLLAFAFGGEAASGMWKAMVISVAYIFVFLAAAYGIFRRQDLTA